MRRVCWMLSLLGGLAACSSQDKNTKIVVAVWSDLAVPSEMDSIHIDVQGPTAASPAKTFALTTSDDLPVVLALVPPNNQDWPFAVTASGFLADSSTAVVSQTATLSFIRGESRLLRLFLEHTCAKGLCGQLVVDSQSLPVYDPKAALSPPDAGAGVKLDGGADVGSADVRGAETLEAGGQTGDGAADKPADGKGGETGTGATGGAVGGTTTGGVGGSALGGSGGIATGGTGGSTVADAAVDKVVTPGDAAPDVTLVPTCDPSIATAQPCSTGLLGICAAGTRTCTSAGVWGPCKQNLAKGTRNCSSSLDNDCDGVADSASSTCVCPVGGTRTCATGLLGVCAAGTQTCVLSVDKSSTGWGACNQTTPKGSETCANPGADDDCDGVVDNVPATACNVNDLAVGACLNGGTTGCTGTTPTCIPSDATIGTTTWKTTAAPNGSWDWNCDGVATQRLDQLVPCAIRKILECTLTQYYELSVTMRRLCGGGYTATQYKCTGSLNCAAGLGIAGTYTQACN